MTRVLSAAKSRWRLVVLLLVVVALVAAARVHVGRGLRLLHVVASGGKTRVFDVDECLLDRDASSGLADQSRRVPGRLVLATALLLLGADVNDRDEDGWTPLHWAAWAGDAALVDLLASRGAEVNSVAEQMTWEMATTDVLAAPTAGLWEGRAKRGRSTPLQAAMARDSVDVAAVLLDRGVAVNGRDEWGSTPLHDAADSGAFGAAELLLSRGAEVNARDDDGWTPLHWAALNDSAEMERLLLDHGAHVNALATKDKTIPAAPILLFFREGVTPLGLAAGLGGDLGAAEVLIAHGADPNVLAQGYDETVIKLSQERPELAALIETHADAHEGQ